MLFAMVLAGCGNVGYYAQAVQGHLAVMRQARPIDLIIDDPSTEPGLRTKLGTVRAIRAFASRTLDLPDNGSYRSYADLGRPYVVWNVFAAPEFSVEPKQWCMLMVGCVGYRGYYDKAEAEALAARLRQEGWDAYVGGVPAYSTLGWFDDPVLNTFLRYGELEVARLMFHELAHQLLFVADDTVFNESFATAVENEGMRRWLDVHGSPGQRELYAETRRRKQQFAALVQATRETLRALYAQPLPDEEKRRAKRETLERMRADYMNLKAGWNGYAGFDPWFAQIPNNAQLISVSLYTQLLPTFEALLAEAGNDLPRFYDRVKALARLPQPQRTAALAAPGVGTAGPTWPSASSTAPGETGAARARD